MMEQPIPLYLFAFIVDELGYREATLKRVAQSSVSTIGSSYSSCKGGGGICSPSSAIEMTIPDWFPACLWFLVINDDTTCLRILELMFLHCLYQALISGDALWCADDRVNDEFMMEQPIPLYLFAFIVDELGYREATLKRVAQSSVSTIGSSYSSCKGGGGICSPSSAIEMTIPDWFPACLWFLVINDDTTCLRILELMFLHCLYQGMSLIF
ncbi:hypothetical protein C1H46_023328 [Malus baccata]|uniref:Uncharacterized protein n=1 Tax=Malus baccata TaxID=106549 RepID=A0A540LX81_MALBA|nr:hypothetical protein C1H46_023328 [Malus baccata]